jgi:hypothetical protein
MIYVIGLLGFFLAYLLPGHYYPWTSFQQEMLAASGAALCALGVIVTSRDWPARLPPLASLAMLTAAIPVAQWLTGLIIFQSDAAISVLYLLAFALTVVTGRQLYLQHCSRFVGTALGAVLAAALASVGICAVQWLQLGPYGLIEWLPAGERIAGNLMAANQLASLLGIGLIGVVWLYERHHIHGAVASLGTAFIGFGVVMTQSRAAWLFLLLLIALRAGLRHRIAWRTSLSAVAVAAAVFVAGIVTWTPLNEAIGFGMGAQPLTLRMQPGLRVIHWQSMLEALSLAPLAGYGWLQVPVAQSLVAPGFPPTGEWLSSSHNLILDLLLWNGVPLGLLVFGALVWWMVSRVGQCRDLDGAVALAVITVLGAHSMVELPLQYMYFLLLAALFVGVIEATGSATTTPALTIGRAGYGTASLLMVAAMYWVSSEYLAVEEQTRRAGLKDAGYVLNGALPSTPDVVLLDGPREYVRLWLTEANEGMTKTEVDWMRDVSTRFPVPPALFRFAVAAALAGRYGEAEHALRVLCHTSTVRNCNGGRNKWAALVVKFPQLAVIQYPVRTSY